MTLFEQFYCKPDDVEGQAYTTTPDANQVDDADLVFLAFAKCLIEQFKCQGSAPKWGRKRANKQYLHWASRLGGRKILITR